MVMSIRIVLRQTCEVILVLCGIATLYVVVSFVDQHHLLFYSE